MGRGGDARGDARGGRGLAYAAVVASGLGLGLAALGLGAAALAAHEFAHSRRLGAPPPSRRRPLTEREWLAASDRDGRVGARIAHVRRRVADGGVDPALRAEVWPLLLGLRHPGSTAVEQEQARRARRDEYHAVKARCAHLATLWRGTPPEIAPFADAGTTVSESAPEGVGGATPLSPANAHRHRHHHLRVWGETGLPPEDLGRFTEYAPVIRADVPRTPFREGPFSRHWRAERDAADAIDERRRRGADGTTTTFTTTTRDAAAERSFDDPDGDVQLGGARGPPTHSWRAAQASRLSAVLSVYALMDARVGYCQGMNEIAAFFLDNVPDESEAFWCFSTFLEAYRPHFVISGGSSSSSGSSARRGEAFEARGGSSSPGRSGTTSRRSSIDGGGEGSGGGGEKEPRPFAATVRERLGELGRILERCDPPMWKHVQLLGGSECMFAFRAVVVLLARELPPSEAAFLWETLMAARDHVEDPRALQPGAGPGEMWAAKKNAGAPREKNPNPTAGSRGGGGGGVRKKPGAPEEEEDGVSSPREEGFPKKGSPEEGGGDADGGAPPAEGGAGLGGNGRLFLHCVAAAFTRQRHLVFACKEFDDLLHAAHHAVANKCVDAGVMLASARELMAHEWRTAHHG